MDVGDRADGLRCRETSWLVSRRAELVGVQRRARAEELAIVGILDERGALERCTGQGVSGRVARETLETARALDALPAIAAAAAQGHLSDEQLTAVAQLADPATDTAWAERAQHCSPAVLQRLVRRQRTPTAEESLARHRARSLRMSWNDDHTVLRINGELPDLMGATVEATIDDLVERMRPAKGQEWEPRDRRAADAFAALCDRHAGTTDDDSPPTLATQPVLVVEVPQHGPAMVGGIALPDTVIEELRAIATLEPVLVDDHGVPTAIGRRSAGLSPKKVRAVLARDGSCVCGCGIRHGLEIHHLVPRSWDGTDHLANLAAVSAPHHRTLIPHGPWAIVANPNTPGALRRVLSTDLTTDQARHYGLPPPPRTPRRP